MQVIHFEPIYQERVWGGRRLASHFKRNLPAERMIGESWEIVDRAEACSLIVRGPGAGCTLRDYLRRHSTFVMGPNWPDDKPFPLLVKWLDAAERLSLQVHPPAHLAARLKGEPKSENWYVAWAGPDSGVYAGFKAGVTKEDFCRLWESPEVEKLLHRLPLQTGDSLFLPSGRLHALDAGCLILEIQQNSDTTYRVYDWGRLGLDGKPRRLHREEALQSIDFNDFEPAILHSHGSEEEMVLVACPIFRLRRFLLHAGAELAFSAGEPRLLHLVDGHLQGVDEEIVKGENVLQPSGLDLRLQATVPTVCLITDRFSN